MDLADILQSATGNPWILRSNKPIEFSPLHDTRSYPREMISVTPLPPHMGLEKAVTALSRMMEPMMWAGTINTQLLRGGVDRALVDIAGNPLTGPVLFALRVSQSGRQGCSGMKYAASCGRGRDLAVKAREPSCLGQINRCR
jgi:hypothetical protein